MKNASWLRYCTRILQIPFFVLPIVDGADEHDFVYFKAAVSRDIAWIKSFGEETSDAHREVLKALEGLNELSPRWLYSAHLAQCWTEHARLHAQLLGQMPEGYRAAALAELACQERKVLGSSKPAWVTLLSEARVAARKRSPETPALLQALFNEIDFARQYSALRIAKYIRLSSIASVLIGFFTCVGTYSLTSWRDGGFYLPVVWLVVVFGLLGGSVSALRRNEEVIGENRAGLRVAEAQLRLRPLLGGMAALVMYAIAQAGVVFQILPAGHSEGIALLQIHVQGDNVPMTYYVLGFLSGFSERFFLGVLDRVGDRFSAPAETPDAKRTPPNDSTSEEPPKQKATDPKEANEGGQQQRLDPSPVVTAVVKEESHP